MDTTADDCLFCRIIAGELPSEQVAATDRAIAIRDVNPVADTHVLVMPRRHVATFNDLGRDDDELVGHLHELCRDVAEQEGVADGYGVSVNVGPGGGQAVFHLHFHVVGGSLVEALSGGRGT